MLTVAESHKVLPLAGLAVEVAPPEKREFLLEAGPYGVRLAVTERDRAEAYRLRFVVFNLELHEGLMSAYADGLDRDQFDAVCDHLLVEDRRDGSIIGTYRLQQGNVAGQNFGYYSEQEFCFAPYEAMRSQIVELGRACIHREHRSPEVLHMLWRGIARYALPRWWTIFDGLLLADFAGSGDGACGVCVFAELPGGAGVEDDGD